MIELLGTHKTAQLHWQSDWNGDEVGYPDIPVVGYYTHGTTNYYINAENGDVLEQWEDNDDENISEN